MSQETLDVIRSEFRSLIGSTGSVHIQEVSLNQGKPIDATMKYTIEAKGFGTYFAIVSAGSHPRTVAQAIRKQESVKAVLGPELGGVIETPMLHGFAVGVSYAVWHFRRPLSGNRVRSKLQRLWLAPRLCRWLEAVTRATICPALKPTYIGSLHHFLDRENLPQPLILSGQTALHDLYEGKLKPLHVLQHGDFWHGNVLLRSTGRTGVANPWGFHLIDWGGAEEEGFPLFDLLKLASSLGFSSTRLASEIERHSRILGVETSQATSYLIVGLAHLGTRLEHFPEGRYIEMASDLHARISSVLG